MRVKEFNTEEEMDEEFDKFEEICRKEQRIKDAICEANERVATASDELRDAECELSDLERQLENLFE